jgi:hypothetical protein
VAPGSGEGDDDSDLGLEDMLLADEEAKAGASLKKIKQKPSATTGAYSASFPVSVILTALSQTWGDDLNCFDFLS